MTGGVVGPVRPVVPQDLAAAATRVVLGLVAALVVLDPLERPLLGLLLVAAVGGFLGAGVVREPWKPAREWVDDLAEVPLVPAAVVPRGTAVRVGLLLGGAGGLALLLAAWVVAASASDLLLLPMVLVLGRSAERLLVTRAVRRWERERDVVLCRRPSEQRFVLLHETDVERMVVVPAT